MTIKGPWDAKITARAKRQNELAHALPKQLQAREMPLKRSEEVTNPTQINQGGTQNQERQPKEQIGNKKPKRNLHSDRDGLPISNAGEPILPEEQGGIGGP